MDTASLQACPVAALATSPTALLPRPLSPEPPPLLPPLPLRAATAGSSCSSASIETLPKAPSEPARERATSPPMCQPPPASPALTAAAAEGSATCRISVARISTKSAMSARLPCCAIRAAEMCESGMPSSADSSRSATSTLCVRSSSLAGDRMTPGSFRPTSVSAAATSSEVRAQMPTTSSSVLTLVVRPDTAMTKLARLMTSSTRISSPSTMSAMSARSLT
mmetsp:Transcript_43683/g.130957  ORF Transcript_43683/g.130957 Transcript_43683/m.130957 type:complete len:222 (-) Transcript_43683:60-725(-)